MNRAEREAWITSQLAAGVHLPSGLELEAARRRRLRALRPKVSVVDRFMAKVHVQDDTGCWLWTGTLWKSGYPRLYVDGQQIRAHRWAYEHFVGPISDGQLVCHRCDVRRCVHPEHLFVGTHAENMADMVDKGRADRGRRANVTRLSEADVRTIRSLAESGVYQREIAAQFGVTQPAVSLILRGHRWADVQ